MLQEANDVRDLDDWCRWRESPQMVLGRGFRRIASCYTKANSGACSYLGYSSNSIELTIVTPVPHGK